MIFLNIQLWLPVWTGSKGQIGVTFLKYFLTINDLYNGAQIVLPLVVVEIWFFLILNFDFRFGQEVKVKLGSLFCKYFFLTINDLYNGAKIVNLPLAVVEIWFFLIVNFDFRFGQEVKVKLGSLFCKYFLTINDLYNGAKIVNLPLAVVEIWFFVKIFNFDFRFGQEVKVKLGSLFCKYFLTNNDLYNGALWIYLLWLLRYDFSKY